MARTNEKPDSSLDSEGWFAVALLGAVFFTIGALYLAGLLSVGWGVK